ncbi:MAG: hypothetical protein IK005_11395 [Paludibacteraceae bacterium]|nr:hypothetical protein [Paludibacteraceae bacterium]
MRNLFMLALAASMGISSFAQEVDQKKGVFEKVIVQPAQVKGGMMPIYAVGASEMASQWKSQGFRLQGESLVTGRYGSNSNLQIESPEISLPTVNNGGRIYLHLNEKFQTESNHDYVRVSVSEDGGHNYRNLCKRSGDSEEYDEYVDVTKYAGKRIIVKLSLTSDGNYEGEGWTINQFDVLKTVALRAAAGLPNNVDLSSSVANLTYLGFSQVGFPKKLNLYFSAHSGNDQFVEGLVKENLTVKVDGSTVSSSCLKLQRLTDFSNMPVQIGFLMDNSGSMQDDIDGVRLHVSDLVQKIGNSMNASAGIFRLGYAEESCPKNFKKDFGGSFLISLRKSNDREAFLNEWRQQHASGSYEPYYSCLYDMIDKQGEYWDGMAQKVIVLIGDETALYDQNANDCTRGTTYQLSDKAGLIDDLRKNGFQVFTIVKNSLTYYDAASNSYKHDESFDGIATSTGGVSIDIENNNGYDEIFDKIAQLLTERYVLTIDMNKCSIEPDPTECPSVEISINGVTTNNAVCPQEQASVERTPSTVEYDTKSVAVGSQNEKVGVMISDIPAGKSVATVEVKMRVHQENGPADEWTTVLVNAQEGDGWYASVPSEFLTENAVVEYRFDVKMNDGNYLLLSPNGVDPDYWTITVYPNTPPSFGEPEVTVSQQPCQPIDICVDLTDDGSVQSAKIMYRAINSVDNFIDANLQWNGSRYCGEIPAKFSMAPGFEYYLTAEDDLGSTTYKATNERPRQYSINDTNNGQSLQVQSSAYTTYAPVTTSQPKECSNFQKGDEIFIYYKNQCDDAYLSLGGYAKVEDPNDLLMATISLSSNGSVKDGLDYGDEMVVKLKRGNLLYDITDPNSKEYYDLISVNMPENAVFVLKGNWHDITNGQTIVSTKDNTNFGYVKAPVVYQYVIENYSGCADIENIKISIEKENSGVSEHFTVSENITEVLKWKSGTFSITYDAKGDEDAIVKITYGDGNQFQFAISGHEAEDKEECQGITFINPVNDQNHVIYINVTEFTHMHVYAIDQDGKLIESLYDNWVSPNPYHGVDLYSVMKKLTPGQAFFVVVERAGKASCTQTIFVDNK